MYAEYYAAEPNLFISFGKPFVAKERAARGHYGREPTFDARYDASSACVVNRERYPDDCGVEDDGVVVDEVVVDGEA